MKCKKCGYESKIWNWKIEKQIGLLYTFNFACPKCGTKLSEFWDWIYGGNETALQM